MRLFIFLFFFVPATGFLQAQLKFVVEDFEGMAEQPGDLKPNGIFTFGNAKVNVDRKMSNKRSYSGDRSLKLVRNNSLNYGGWGKGIGVNIELDVNTDHLNFYAYQPESNNSNTIKIELQEDDNGSNVFEKDSDDSWSYLQKMDIKGRWNLISIPLSKFKDENAGGDGVFNASYKKGKLLTLIVTLENFDKTKKDQCWSFDFICLSKGPLPVGKEMFDAPGRESNDFCSLGAWSKEGNTADFSDIGLNFESNFKSGCDKKLGVIHFFQPFAVDGGNTQNLYPSIGRVNKIIEEGYIPLITLEDHFVNAHPATKQPNLYSIIEGHFDPFFKDWAKQIKQVDGIVLLRILHEFNGDWYPWCTVNNDKDPQMVIKAFKHIHSIFKKEAVSNVKFIWCPNSMSFPQESWNQIMNAYPGDEFVDYVGLDVYNGAGKDVPVWRSFRKEGIENYFILTQQLPGKPLFICEAASRERTGSESPTAQSKAEWIKDMSDALSSDMSKIKLLTWFNEKESFKVNSSPASQKAFLNYVMKNDYFRSGVRDISIILGQ